MRFRWLCTGKFCTLHSSHRFFLFFFISSLSGQSSFVFRCNHVSLVHWLVCFESNCREKSNCVCCVLVFFWFYLCFRSVVRARAHSFRIMFCEKFMSAMATWAMSGRFHNRNNRNWRSGIPLKKMREKKTYKFKTKKKTRTQQNIVALFPDSFFFYIVNPIFNLDAVTVFLLPHFFQHLFSSYTMNNILLMFRSCAETEREQKKKTFQSHFNLPVFVDEFGESHLFSSVVWSSQLNSNGVIFNGNVQMYYECLAHRPRLLHNWVIFDIQLWFDTIHGSKMILNLVAWRKVAHTLECFIVDLLRERDKKRKTISHMKKNIKTNQFPPFSIVYIEIMDLYFSIIDDNRSMLTVSPESSLRAVVFVIGVYIFHEEFRHLLLAANKKKRNALHKLSMKITWKEREKKPFESLITRALKMRKTL